jgi:hypothetical protein
VERRACRQSKFRYQVSLPGFVIQHKTEVVSAEVGWEVTEVVGLWKSSGQWLVVSKKPKLQAAYRCGFLLFTSH